MEAGEHSHASSPRETGCIPKVSGDRGVSCYTSCRTTTYEVIWKDSFRGLGIVNDDYFPRDCLKSGGVWVCGVWLLLSTK